MKKFKRLTLVDIFLKKIWPVISEDVRFKELLKRRKERIKEEVKSRLRNRGKKDRNPEVIIEAFWFSLYKIYEENKETPEVNSRILEEINKIIQEQFKQTENN